MSIQSTAAASGATIDPADLAPRLASGDLVIVDVRSLNGFNGWRLGDEARGGHIPGAVAFPAAWLDSVERGEIERLLVGKGIVPGADIVLYDNGPAAAGEPSPTTRVAELLAGIGIDRVRTLDGGFPAWASDPA